MPEEDEPELPPVEPALAPLLVPACDPLLELEFVFPAGFGAPALAPEVDPDGAELAPE